MTGPTGPMGEREAFEAYAANLGLSLRRGVASGNYQNRVTETHWMIWHAAWGAAVLRDGSYTVRVPHEPTAEMLVAGNRHNCETVKTVAGEGINPQVWRDMVEAWLS